MNTIQPKITCGNTAFGARVKMSNLSRINAYRDAEALVGSSGLGTMTSSAVVASATETVGSGLNTVGTAFSAKAMGTNSSGIVPAVMGSAAPHVTPATIASSEAHPSTMGSVFSTIGDWFHSLVKIKTNTKNPS